MATPREAAFRVAVLDALHRRVKKALDQARAEAAPVFAEFRRQGSTQVEVALPSGERVGTVSIKAGGETLVVDEEALLKWVLNTRPDEVEVSVSSAALSRPDVVAYVRKFHPHLVEQKVRPSYRTVLLEQLTEDGELIDHATGEVAKVAERRRRDPDGSFQLTFASAGNGRPNGRDRIAEAWQSGELSIADVLLPALEAPRDEHGGEAAC